MIVDQNEKEAPLIEPQLTRHGLNALIINEGKAAKAITHIGLSSEVFLPSQDTQILPSEIHRWPVLDGYESTQTQITIYAKYPWQGEDTPIRGIGFYIDDILLASYCNQDTIEAFLTPRVLLDSWYHLAFDAAPLGSITVANTGYIVNPGFSAVEKAIYNLTLAQRNDLLLRLDMVCEDI